MRGGGEGGAVGAGDSALRFTENSQQLVEVFVHMAGPGAPLLGRAWAGRGRLMSRAGGTAGGLPCSHKMGFSVLCELALRWQLWELRSLCAKTRAVRLLGHFPFFSPLLEKKNCWRG